MGETALGLVLEQRFMVVFQTIIANLKAAMKEDPNRSEEIARGLLLAVEAQDPCIMRRKNESKPSPVTELQPVSHRDNQLGAGGLHYQGEYHEVVLNEAGVAENSAQPAEESGVDSTIGQCTSLPDSSLTTEPIDAELAVAKEHSDSADLTSPGDAPPTNAWQQVRSRRERRGKTDVGVPHDEGTLDGSTAATKKKESTTEADGSSVAPVPAAVSYFESPRLAPHDENDSTGQTQSSSLCNPDLWSARTPSASGATLFSYEKSVRAWEKFAEMHEDAWRRGEGMDAWHAKRKANALSRLLFMGKDTLFKGQVELEKLFSDLQAPSCCKCIDDGTSCRICSCSLQSFSHGSDSVADATTTTNCGCSTEISDETDSFDENAILNFPPGLFAPPPGLEIDEDRQNPRWRHLLRTAPFDAFNSPASSARSQNVAWRRWWEAHRSDGRKFIPGFSDFFPATPTSTTPGTPKIGFSEESANTSTIVVNIPVPIHLTGQLQQCIAYLMATPNAEVVARGDGLLLRPSE